MNDGLGMAPTGIIREEGRWDRIKITRGETLFTTLPNNFSAFLDHQRTCIPITISSLSLT